MKIRLLVSALAAMSVMPAAWGQGAAAGAPNKVGVINVQIAITSTAEGKQAAAELQSKFSPRQTELDNMRKQLDDLQTRLRTGQTTLSDDEKARLAREGDVLTRTYQRKQQEALDARQRGQTPDPLIAMNGAKRGSGYGLHVAQGFGLHFCQCGAHDFELRVSVELAQAGIGEHLEEPRAAGFVCNVEFCDG